MFYEDAKTAARVLGLTLTSRDKGENRFHGGLPYHQLDSYLGKLIAAGFRRRCASKSRTPEGPGSGEARSHAAGDAGDPADDALLDPASATIWRRSLFPAGRRNARDQVGLAWADLSTGRFYATVASRAVGRLSWRESGPPNACQ